MRATIFNWLKWPAAISAASPLPPFTPPAKDVAFAGEQRASCGTQCFGGEGGIRTHEHPLRCYWNSSPAPSTARPPLQSMTYESFLERIPDESESLSKKAAHDKASGRGLHQACGGAAACRTLNGGGSSRHGSLPLRAGGAGSLSAR